MTWTASDETIAHMKTSVFVLACVLAAGLGFAASPAVAQNSTAGKTGNAPAAKAAAPAQSAAQPSSPLKDDRQKLSYALGLSWGKRLLADDVQVDTNLLLQGLKDGIAGGKALMTDDEAHSALMDLQGELQAKEVAKQLKESDTNKAEGEAFLAANKSKPGVVVLPSGLQYKILTAGTGAKPAATDTVVCNYRGTLVNGKEFDSSYKRGEPATIPVSGVIKGWTEALQLMPVGSKWQLFIPPDLAYGDHGAGGDIGPNATLVFEVELISIQPAEAKK